MYDVLIQCSETGRLVPTGLLINPENADAIPTAPLTLSRCRDCGSAHGWSRFTAVLAAAGKAG